MVSNHPASQPPAPAGGLGFADALALVTLVQALADLTEQTAQRLAGVERDHDALDVRVGELAARVEQIAQILAIPAHLADPADPATWPF